MQRHKAHLGSVTRMGGSAKEILRNSGWNLAGQALPAAAALIAIPALIGILGAERFGVLALIWGLVGYFSIFDLGIGRALTKVLSERLGTGTAEISVADIVGTGLALTAVSGLLGAAVLFGLADVIGRSIVSAASSVTDETVSAIHILSPAIFLVIVASSLRGTLEAHQRFKLINAIRSPIGALTFLAPVAFAARWNSLSAITLGLVAVRGLEVILYAVACKRLVTGLDRTMRLDRTQARLLIAFGGWMTVTNVVSPLMTYLDRFLIAGAVSLVSLAYYSTPYELVTKLQAIPVAIVQAAFPAFSRSLGADAGLAKDLYARTLGYTFAAVLPLAGAAVAFAREGLGWWIDPVFAAEGATVARWLATGIFLNAIALVPFTLLQAAGRPDLIAKLHVVELPFYLAALVWLVGALGIVGAALAWTGRMAVDTVVLLVLSSRMLSGGRAITKRVLTPTVSALALLAGAATVESVIGRLIIIGSLFPLALFTARILAANTLNRRPEIVKNADPSAHSRR
jgi:O-antigen/teichoic acid export membrane protein